MTRAADILRSLGVTDPTHIDVEAIAYHLGAKVRYGKLEGCAARILGNGNKAIIRVDRGSPRTRQRFSVGHELGHWILHRGHGGFLCSKQDMHSSGQKEGEANRFASQLLMPAYLFKPRVMSSPAELSVVSLLANEFSTSLTATARRWAKLSPRRLMLAAYNVETGNRSFFERGQRLSPDVHAVRQLNPESPLAAFIFSQQANGAVSAMYRELADTWLTGAWGREVRTQALRVPGWTLVMTVLDD